MDDDQKRTEEHSRSVAAEAFRYKRPEAAQRSIFQTLDISAAQTEAASEAGDSLLAEARLRFPSKAPF